jgi:hypothetical protein
MLKGLFTRNSCLLHVNRPHVRYGIEKESNFTAIRKENVIESRINFFIIILPVVLRKIVFQKVYCC